MPRTTPIINGHLFSFASIEFDVGDVRVIGVRSITYWDSLEPGKIWGTGPSKTGRTVGKADAHIDFDIYRSDWDTLRPALAAKSKTGRDFGVVPFTITVMHHEVDPDGQTRVAIDVIDRCRITRVEPRNQDGAEPSSLAIACDAMAIFWGGETAGHTMQGSIDHEALG